MAPDAGSNSHGITSQIAVAVFVALLAGGTAPWWWGPVTSQFSTATTSSTTSPGQGGPTITTTSAPTTTTTESTPASDTSDGCRVAIGNPLAILYEGPDRFSQEIMQIPAGEHRVVEIEMVTRINEQRWLRIDVDGTLGWIPDDTWTVDSRKDCNF